MEFAYCIKGGDSEVGEEDDEILNVMYTLPLLEDPKLSAKVRPEISSVDVKKYFDHWRSPFKLKGYEIYPRTRLRVARKKVGLIL